MRIKTLLFFVFSCTLFLTNCGEDGSSIIKSNNVTSPFLPPSGVSAVGGNLQTNVNWTAVSGATSYNIYWSTTSGVTKSTGIKISGASSPYNHTGLINGTTYYYVVTSLNAAEESAESPQISAIPNIFTKQLGISGKATIAHGVATDFNGNIIVGGYTTGGLDGNTLTGVSDFFVTKYDLTGSKQWTKQLGASGQSTGFTGVTTDIHGNIFVSGYTYGGLDGNTLTGTCDYFLTKYDSTGAKQWTKQHGVSGVATQAWGVATNANGNIFVAGYTYGGLDGNTLTGANDLFVTKYDTTGALQWTKQLGVSGNHTVAWGVATDSNGNIFVAGYTDGGLDGNTLTGVNDLFVTKYDSTGSKLWTKQLGVSGKLTNANGVATDSLGNAFLAGYTNGGLDGNTLTGTLDFFVTKYDSTGSKQWTKQLGASGGQTTATRVATGSNSNVFLAGYTTGGLDGNVLTGIDDFFVTKYDSTGSKQWTKQLGVSAQNTNAYGITTDFLGNIFVTGSTTGGLDGHTITGTYDFFLAKYITNGNRQ